MNSYMLDTLYSSICSDIRRIDIRLERIHSEMKSACIHRRRKLDRLEWELLTKELPRLRRIAFNIRINH